MSTADKFPFVDLPKPNIDEKYLVQLPNGMTLKWAPPRKQIKNDAFPFEEKDKSLQQFIAYAETRIKEAILSGDKERIKLAKSWCAKLNAQPRLSTQKVIIADFDTLPAKLGFNSWDSFYEFLVAHYADSGVVCRSVSNKVKIFFLVDYKYAFVASYQASRRSAFPDFTVTGGVLPERSEVFGPPLVPPLQTKDCVNFLERLLRGDNFILGAEEHRVQNIKNRLFEFCDKSKTAMSTTLLSADMFEKLKYLRQSRIHFFSAGPYVANEEKEESEIVNVKRYRLFEGDLPKESLFFVNGKRPDTTKEHREKLIRYLLASPMLADEGYDLPIALLKQVTGVSKRSVSKWLKELCQMQILECVEETVLIGEKAKTYVAHGWLLEHLELHCPPASKGLDRSFPDGEWDALGYLNLKRLIGGLFRQNDDEIRLAVEKYVDSLPGIDALPDRRPRLLRQADHIISHLLPKWRSK